MKIEGNIPLKIFMLLLAAIIAALFCLYVFFFVPRIMGSDDRSEETAEDRQYHVLVVGKPDNESALQEIYAGAEEVCRQYNCVVELRVPKSQVEDESLQALFDYASFTEPDGVIAYMDADELSVHVPVDSMQRNIPLITLTQYYPSVPQVSYIGTNYSQLGQLIAREGSACLNGCGSVIVINTDESNNPNYSTLMSSLTNMLGVYRDIHTDVMDFSSLGRTISQNEVDLIVCLTEEDTIRAAQTVSDMSRGGSVQIIGFGEGDIVNMYLSKGIVTELIYIDSKKIGRTAMSELFEYIKYGYANNYISADVCVRRTSGK